MVKRSREASETRTALVEPGMVSRAAQVLSLYEEAPTGKEKSSAARAFADRAATLGATVETVVHATMSPHPLDDRRSNITPEQRAAGQLIALAFQIITVGGLPRCADLSGMPRGGRGNETESEWTVRLQRDYSNWTEQCRYKNIPRHLALVYCVDGLSARQIDRAYKWRNGTAIERIREALDLFAEIRGITYTPRGKHRFIGEMK